VRKSQKNDPSSADDERELKSVYCETVLEWLEARNKTNDFMYFLAKRFVSCEPTRICTLLEDPAAVDKGLKDIRNFSSCHLRLNKSLAENDTN
jgi:hypothetical protein